MKSGFCLFCALVTIQCNGVNLADDMKRGGLGEKAFQQRKKDNNPHTHSRMSEVHTDFQRKAFQRQICDRSKK